MILKKMKVAEEEERKRGTRGEEEGGGGVKGAIASLHLGNTD